MDPQCLQSKLLHVDLFSNSSLSTISATLLEGIINYLLKFSNLINMYCKLQLASNSFNVDLTSKKHDK